MAGAVPKLVNPFETQRSGATKQLQPNSPP